MGRLLSVPEKRELGIITDDRDDDGKVDFDFTPVRPAPEGDWFTQRLTGGWAQAARIPGEMGFGDNRQLRFGLRGPAGAKGR